MALNVGELYASFGIDTSGVDKALSSIESKFSSFGKSLTVAGAAMTAAVTVPLVKLGKDIYQTGTDFGSAMSRVFATAGMDKAIASDAAAMDALREKAIQMGSTTKFTSAQAAEAMNYMAMAGWKAEDMLQGIAPVMNLAAASGEDLGTVSDILTDAMTAFGYSITEANVGHFGDVLAKTAASANTNVAMLGESFKFVAPLAGTLGYSVDDISVALGLMANSGIKASQAGTTLRSMISRMASPTKQTQQAMDKLGLSLTDDKGNMKSFATLMKDLRVSMSKLSKEEQAAVASQLAGKNAMSGLLAIVNASEEDYLALTEAIEGASGAAEQMAKTALDNAAGDIVYLTSAVDGAKISLWELAEGPFRKIVQNATKYVNAFNEMDDATKLGVLRTAAFTAGIGPAAAALGGLVAVLPNVAKALVMVNSPLGLVSVGLLALGAAAIDTDNSIGQTMERISKTIGDKMGEAADNISAKTPELVHNAGEFLESLRQSIENALPNILAAGGDVIIAVLDGISLNMDKITAVGLEIVSSVRGAIVAYAPLIIPAALQLVRNLIVGMLINIPNFVSEIGQIAIAIGAEIVSADWSGTAEGIWTALQTAITGTKEVLGNLGDLVKEKFQADSWTDVAIKIWNGLWNGIKMAKGYATTIVLSIIQGISGSSIWSSGAQSFVTIATQIVDSISEEIPKLFENVDGIVNAGISLGNKIIDGVNTAITSMNEAGLGGKLVGVAAKIIQGIFSTVGNLAQNEDVLAFIGKLGEGLKGAMTTIGDIAGEIVKQLSSDDSWASLGTSVGTLAGKLIESLASAIPSAIDAAGNILNAGFMLGEKLLELIVNGFNSFDLTTNFGSVVQALVTNIANALPQALELGGKVITAVGEIASGLIDKIAKAFSETTAEGTSTIDFSGFVTNIANSIAGWNGWESLGTSFTGIAEKLISTIAGAIPSVISGAEGLLQAGLNIGTAILSGISTALKSMNISEIGAELADGAIRLVKGLLTTISSDDMKGSVTTFISTLGQALIDFASVIGDFAGTFVGNLLSYIFSEEGVTAIFNAGKTLLEIMCNGLIAALSGIGSLVGNFFDKLLIALGLVDPEERDAFRKSGQILAAQVAAGMEEGLAGDTAAYTRAASLAAAAFVNGVTIDTDNAAFVEISNAFREAMTSISAGDPDDFKDSVIDYVSRAASRLGTELDFSGITDEMWAQFYTAWESKDWSGLMDSLNFGKEDILDGSQEAAQEWADKTAEAVEQYATGAAEAASASSATVAKQMGGAAQAGVDSYTTTLANGAQPAQEAAAAVGDAAVQQFLLTMSAENGTTIAQSFVNAIIDTMTSGGVTLARVANIVSSDVLSILQSTLSAGNGFSIGNNFALGMQNGIRSGIAGIVAAAREGGEAAVQALREAIQEGSPSKLTQRSGVFFALGFEEGIERSISSVKKTVENMGESAVDALDMAARGYGTASHTRLPSSTASSKTGTSLKDMIKAATAAANAAAATAEAAASEASYETRTHSGSSASSGYTATDSAAASALGGAGGGVSTAGADLTSLIETYARLVATALNDVKVEMDSQEVGSLVAPVVSETIARNALARSNGTV